MTTYLTELDAQCNAVLAVLRAAHPLCVAGEGHRAWVLLRPAMAAVRVPRHSQRYFERELREAMDDPPQLVVIASLQNQRNYVFVTMQAFVRCLYWAGHPVATPYVRWHMDVLDAMMRHGWYDPATNHTPPPERTLDALEQVERGRDLFNGLMPGMGDAMTGHRPTTEAGRRLLWHRVVDDEGTVHMVNDADIPEEEEDDDADQ
jgi:hypothetical protein